MTSELMVAFIGVLTVVVGAPLATLLTLAFNRRKNAAETAQADAEADVKRMQAVFSQVEPLHRIIATLDSRVAEQSKEVHSLAERIVGQQIKLDAAEEQLGALARREREFLVYQAAVSGYVELVTERLRHAGLEVPDPPPPPPPRSERTRRDDYRGGQR